MIFFIGIALLLAVFWVAVVRPQRRRQLEAQRLLESVEVGDEIVTAGGLFGTIRSLGETQAQVEIAPGLVVRVARRAIAGIVTPEERAELEPGDANL